MVARWAAAAVYDADAQALFDAAEITSTTVKNAVNTLILDFKASGFWTTCGAIYGMAGDNVQQTYASQYKFNWKNPLDTDAAFRLSFTNTPTCDANGIDFNGLNQYADTHIVPSTDLSLNDVHSSYYSRSNLDGNFDIGVIGVNSLQEFAMIIKRPGGTYYSIVYDESGSLITGTLSDGSGYFMNSRISSTSHEFYRNGSSFASNTSANAGTRPAFSIFLAAENNSGSPGGYSTKQCAFASFGTGVSSSLAASTYTSIQTYQTALSRNV